MALFGIQNSDFILCRDYLDSKQECIQINNDESDYLRVNCNIPEGSILWLLLPIIYANDLPNVLDKMQCYTRHTLIFSYLIHYHEIVIVCPCFVTKQACVSVMSVGV